MTIARTTASISIGTVATTATTLSAEQDPRADDASEGSAFVYLTYTGTTAAGSIDVAITQGPTTTTESTTRLALMDSIIPINGTETNILLGNGPIDLDRFFKVSVKNNAIGASITSVTVNISHYKRV